MTQQPAATRKVLIGLTLTLCLALPGERSAMAECGIAAMPCAAMLAAAAHPNTSHHQADHRTRYSSGLPCCGAGACLIALLPAHSFGIAAAQRARTAPVIGDALLRGIVGPGIDHPPRRLPRA